jgi:hypothetical protein
MTAAFMPLLILLTVASVPCQAVDDQNPTAHFEASASVPFATLKLAAAVSATPETRPVQEKGAFLYKPGDRLLFCGMKSSNE